MSEFNEVPFATPVPEGHAHTAFFFVVFWAPIYAHYPDDVMNKEQREGLYPLIVMQNRWDGHLGGVGGKVDPSDKGDARKACVREGSEEINLPVDYTKLVPLVSHQSETTRIDAFIYDLGTLTMDQAHWILEDAAQATHTICEGTTAMMHLCDYGKGRGWPNLRSSNMLSTMVGEELDAVMAYLVANQPEGAFIVWE